MPSITKTLEHCVTSPPNILATLQKVQSVLGYVPQSAVPEIATALGVTESDVAGVLSFYHDLRTNPPGKHIIRFCMGESCLAMKGEKTIDALRRKLVCDFGETTRDGRFSLEKVYCLGNCALSPCMMIDERVHGKVQPATLPKLLKDCRR